MTTKAIALLGLISLLQACNTAEPASYDICTLARNGSIANGSLVKTQAIGLFGDHGAFITGRSCLNSAIEWKETRDFHDGVDARRLSDAIEHSLDDPTHPKSIEVTVVGRFTWHAGSTHPSGEIIVMQLSDIRLVGEVQFGN